MTSDQSPGQSAGEKDTTGAAGDPATGQSADTSASKSATAAPGDTSTTTGKRAEKPAKARKADPKADSKADSKSSKSDKAKAAAKAVPALVRTRVAQAVWILCVLAAAFLALGALVIALDFNQQNAAVEFVLNGASQVDLGVFTRDEGIKQFSGENAEIKNALVNYGVGAVFWIVVGRVADRLIRP